MSDTRQEFLHNSGANIFYSEYFPADPQAPHPHPAARQRGGPHLFVKQIPAFSPHFRLVLMDTRGQGQSPAVTESSTSRSLPPTCWP